MRPRRCPLVVPDTNALVDDPDLRNLQSHVGTPRFDVLLLPVVLGELDDLKRDRRDDVREAARRAVRQIKGLRDRGNVRDGVTLTHSATVRFEVVEPDFGRMPSWLDSGVPDDRLVAAALRAQAAHPAAALVVVTGDLNLQNKLAAAGLPFADPEA